MKFLCVPCDSPMKLQAIAPPDRGSLSVVYACPECGYEMAMLTNAYETQVVQSLGVRIGPASPGASGASASQAESAAAPGCPFTAMLSASAEATADKLVVGTATADEPGGQDSGDAPSTPVRWTSAAEARLTNIPEFVRPMARTGIERFARERGALEVNDQILDAARDFFGM